MFKYFSVIICLFFFNTISAQSDVVPKIQSPNAAAIDKYGEVPVNLFTGSPRISIPLHTIVSGSIKLPISLNYHPASVKPNQHPGWVGLGWNIECYGIISRTLKGKLDEFGGSTSEGAIVPYYPNASSQISGSEKVNNTTDWYSSSALHNYYTLQPGEAVDTDVEADEFTFNFFGHSGKFYYAGPSLGWVVISNENIKIEMDGFLEPTQIIAEINQYTPSYTLGYNEATLQPRMFLGFTLTMEDGSKYTFGGSDAVEFSSPYGAAPFPGVRADSWLLKKVTDVYGNTVNFQYNRDYINCALSGTFINKYATCVTNGGLSQSGSEFSFQPVNMTKLSGSYIFPMYLQKITSSTETIQFLSSVAQNITRYTDLQLNPWNPQDPNLTLIDKNIANLQWKKLDNFVVRNNNNLSGAYVRSYNFGYISSPIQRLTLGSFQESTGGPNSKHYTFSYDALETLPGFNGNYTDHWGFYNNIDITGASASQIYNLKEPNPTYTIKGLLNKIRYPAGGYTEFTWEANSYSKVVSNARNSLASITGYAGGGRIREVRNYSATGQLSDKKNYYYVTGYSSSTNPSTLSSSGVLNGTPRYNFYSPNRVSYTGATTVTYGETSLYTAANYSYSGGSHIGYNEVTEVNADGSYTKHYFTNYGVDINGVSHFDQAPLGSIGWITGDDPYMPFSSLELERGFETAVFDYKSNNILLRKKNIFFRTDLGRFNEFVKQIIFTNSYGCNVGSALQFVASNKIFKYNYYPVKTELTTYDSSGNNPVVETKTFTYNNYNQLASETANTSVSNENEIVRYYYPNDLPTDPQMSTLITANRINSVILTETYRNTQKLTAKKNIYANDVSTGNLPLVKYEYAAKYPNSLPSVTSPPVGQMERLLTYVKYDTDSNGNANGKLLEYNKEKGIPVSIIWGYNKQLPIAIIEGAPYSTIEPYVSNLQNISDLDIDSGPNGPSENNLRVQLNGMRDALLLSNPTLKIKTYTHNYIAGVTSITDEKNYTTFYEYNNLLYVKSIKDIDGNILEEFEYQYKMN
ncbi:hypothetical protein [Flavobacterium sp. AG291]|uniref:hypothetical protein n=1 Tax=Flavobacterium sp. AG291 TaxID=2184000 RepID=UPI000E0A8DF6|nr:hypothetical protein [Flavobacterium sp. AG291]RDI06662.1 hypothetical protein DEU42_1147 [Flavobacterium sp. AG291]